MLTNAPTKLLEVVVPYNRTYTKSNFDHTQKEFGHAKREDKKSKSQIVNLKK